MKAKDAMTRRIVTIPPNAMLHDAWQLMRANDIRHLLVLEEGQLVGLLSDRDVLGHSTVEDKTLIVPKVPLEQVMRKDVLFCRPSHSIASVANTMRLHKIDALPVLHDEKLVGLVTSSDLLGLLTEQPFENRSLESLPFTMELIDWDQYNLEALASPKPD